MFKINVLLKETFIRFIGFIIGVTLGCHSNFVWPLQYIFIVDLLTNGLSNYEPIKERVIIILLSGCIIYCLFGLFIAYFGYKNKVTLIRLSLFALSVSLILSPSIAFSCSSMIFIGLSHSGLCGTAKLGVTMEMFSLLSIFGIFITQISVLVFYRIKTLLI